MSFNRAEGYYFCQLVYRLGIMLVFFFLCRALFYFFNQSFFSFSSYNELFILLIKAIRFDIATVIYLNFLLILSFLIPSSARSNPYYQKGQGLLFLGVNSLALLFCFIDIAFFPYAQRRLIASDFFLLNNTSNLIPQFLADFWYLSLVFVVFLVALSWTHKKIELKADSQTKSKLTQWSIGLVGIIFFFILARGLQLRPLSSLSTIEYVDNIQDAPLINNTILGLIFSTQQRSLNELEFYDKEELDSRFPIIHSHPHRQENKKNVVIIVLESFGKEHIGYFNKGKGFTPFLDSLIQESYYSEQSFANGLRSAQGIFSIISGIPGLMEDPFIFSSYQRNKIEGIPSYLSQLGYHTAFFHGSNPGSMEFEKFSKMVGFDHFYDRQLYPNQADYDGNWGIWDYPFFQFTAQELNKFDTPFMSLLFSLSSHHPYKVESWFEQKYPNINNQNRSILYTDYALRAFFDTIKQMPWYDNTLFVITADHTGKSEIWDYKTKVGLFKVPILFYEANSKLKGTSSIPIQHVDIPNTVLDYLAYKHDYISFGKNAFDTIGTHYSYMYLDGLYQIFDKDHALLFDGEKTIGLFNYHRDIGLNKDISDKYPLKRQALEDQIKGVLQQYNHSMINNKLHTKAQ